TYGGKYLSELQSKYPDLFTTRAISTGVAPDPTTHITKWSAKYENGTSLQNIGIGLAVKLPNGDYAYLDGGNNDKFKTTLPEQMGSIGYYVQQELQNRTFLPRQSYGRSSRRQKLRKQRNLAKARLKSTPAAVISISRL
ncbi:MAG: glycoside hydrolase family 70 protein, partial [Lactobacillus delbrueckii]